MGHRRVNPSRPEIDHKKTHRIVRRREFQPARGTLLRRRDHRTIEVGGIGIRDDYVGFQFRSVLQANARGPPLFDHDGINRGIELDLDAVSLP